MNDKRLKYDFICCGLGYLRFRPGHGSRWFRMLEAIYILLGVIGLAMFGTALVITLPEIAIDSPFELLLSLVSRRRFQHMYDKLAEHIREGWPDTQIVAFLFYGGAGLIGIAIVLFCIDSWL